LNPSHPLLLSQAWITHRARKGLADALVLLDDLLPLIIGRLQQRRLLDHPVTPLLLPVGAKRVQRCELHQQPRMTMELRS
jgi:hypothetical protein